MNVAVKNLSLEIEDISLREAYRYMGVRGDRTQDELQERVDRLLPQFLREISGRACFLEVPITVDGECISMDVLTVRSRHLAAALQGCHKAILFAATLGGNVDRMYRSAAVNAPVSALVIDALGTAAIESLCDKLCDGFKAQYTNCLVRPRFSPGYGDLPLDLQKDLIRVLDANRKIGLTLSDSLLMIPQKSVTAIVGLRQLPNMTE